MLPRARRRVAALLCSGALAVAACGDNTPGTSTPDTTTPDTTTPGTSTPDTSTPATVSSASDAATPDTATPDAATPGIGAPPTVEEAPEESASVPEILQVSAPVVGGGELDLADFAERPLLLWFWAPF